MEITMSHPKVIESPHYHLWTDALHARSLARQAKNKWDRGTYVCWTITTSWAVLEVACQDALNEPNISYSFRKNLDKAIINKGFIKIEWGSGIWQRVSNLQNKRKGYVHRFISENDFFPDAGIADESIDIIRQAVVAIYQHVNRPVPTWVRDDDDRGWDSGKRSGASLTLIHPGADENDPEVIKLFYVYLGKEKLTDVLPKGTDYLPYVEDLIQKIRVPISAIRVYKGISFVYERELNMRGT
jgi:hypothetical protein